MMPRWAAFAAMMLMAAPAMMLQAVPAMAQEDDEPAAAQAALPTQTLTIQRPGGPAHKFTVEMATTPRQQQVGEMFRISIPADHGMFFDWGYPREMPMWMKNCPVPEDMVFIGADGAISHIAENTVPNSLANIGSGGPVRATLELQGGITAKLDIRVGDKITGAVFGK